MNSVEQRIRRGNERISGPDEQQIEKDREKKLDTMRAEVSAILKLAEEAGETVILWLNNIRHKTTTLWGFSFFGSRLFQAL